MTKKYFIDFEYCIIKQNKVFLETEIKGLPKKEVEFFKETLKKLIYDYLKRRLN